MIRLADLPEYPELNALSPVRANLVRTLELAGTERVLVIGADSAAVTAFFARRCKKVDALCLSEQETDTQNHVVQEFDNIRLIRESEEDSPYDLVIAAGSVVQAEKLCKKKSGNDNDSWIDVIRRRMLSPEGRILLADDKTVFADRVIPHLPEALENERSENSGFLNVQCCCVLPDYRFPMELRAVNQFSEVDSESVLMILSEKPAPSGKLTPVYTKFSNERRPECAVYTQILSSSDGKKEHRIVRKYPVTQNAADHIRRIERVSEKLRKQYAGTGIGVNRCCVKEQNHSAYAEFEYLTGETYEQKVNRILQREGTEAAIAAICDFIAQFIPESKCIPFHFVPAFAERFGNRAHEPSWRRTLPLTNIDMILENVIKPGSDYQNNIENNVQYQMIDCEWTTEIPVPVEFLIWRIVHYYLDGNPAAEALMGAGIYEKCGLSGNLDVYLDMENQFQKWIEGDVIPLHKIISATEEEQRKRQSEQQSEAEETSSPPVQLSMQQKLKKHGSYLLRHGYKGYRYMLQTRPYRPFDERYGSWIRAHFAGRKPDAYSEKNPEFGIILLRGRFDSRQYTAARRSVEQQRYGNCRVYTGTVLRKLIARAVRECDYLVLLPSGYFLTPDALQYFAAEIHRKQEEICQAGAAEMPRIMPDLVYADEDCVTKDGKTAFDPVFKPDFSIDYLRAWNYIGKSYCVSSRAVKNIPLQELQTGDGFFYDLLLRVCEMAQAAEKTAAEQLICHVPEVLVRRIAQEGKTSADLRREKLTGILELEALQQHYQRCGIAAEVTADPVFPVFRTNYYLQREPLISVIVPNKDHAEELRACIDSFETLSAYRKFEWIIVENNSTEEKTFDYYQELQQKNRKVTVVTYEGIFNYAKINNFGVRHAKGEYLLLLNNDTELISPGALGQLVGTAMQEGVGIAGARLLYPDHRVQHGGIGLGIGGIAGHLFTDLEENDPGSGYRALSTVNYSAVTAACLLVKKSLYETVGGMEESLAVAFNDVDFCLKVRAKGKRVVYCGDAVLYHKESRSRGLEDTQEKVDRFYSEIIWFIEKWRDEICAGDPYYNRNLSTESNPFYCLR